MADPSPSPSQFQSTNIMDLDVDSLAHCAEHLSLEDLSNLAMSSKHFKRITYSDSIWLHRFRERWPQQIPSSSVREAYLAKRITLQQFKFDDPLVADYYTAPKPCDQIVLDKNGFFFSQGSLIQMIKMDSVFSGSDSPLMLSDHNARITCMRLFSLDETSLFQRETQSKENVLVTSSCDHSIRLWWKGSCQRCFRGHNGPVSTLSDKLLGDGIGKVLASGGEDGTVQLWSFTSSGKRGQHARKATLYGHGKPVKLMSVAGHKSSLLVTISRDSKVRVWDTTTATSAVRSSCCVGMISVPGSPVNMKCHESLLYVAAGSSVIAIDLRTMRKVLTAANCQPKLYSFEILPSKSLICTGGSGRAMLWDIRRNQETMKPEPIAELDGHHTSSVAFLHMDPYKIVTGGPEDSNINVWETDTGTQTNSLSCDSDSDGVITTGCAAMAVNGFRIVTSSCNAFVGLLRIRDFSNATCPVVKSKDEHASKFWDPQPYSDTDTDEDW